MLIDTHTHLYSSEFDADRNQLIQKAIHSGINKFLLPNINVETIEAMMAVQKSFPQNCFPMIGLHPCEVKENFLVELNSIEHQLANSKFVGVGEIGIDLYWDKTFIKQQQEAFKIQLNWATQYDYGISIHCRDAFDEVFDVLKSCSKLPRMVFHCFSGNLMQAQQLLEFQNIKLGIGGVLTFKNSGLDKVVEQIDLKHLVLETDAPYLAPVPFRGKRNEPIYLLEIAKRLAEIKNCSFDELAKITSENALEIFNLNEYK